MAERFGGLLVTIFRTLAGAAVSALMIGGLNPEREFGIELLQIFSLVVQQTQSAFKALLNSLDDALTFSFAPTVVRLAVEQANAQFGADHPGVSIDEGLALVGVEFARQSPTQHGFFQSVMKRFGIGLAIVGAERNQSRVIVNKNAQMSAEAFSLHRQHWARREVDHPQVVNLRRFEGFGRTALQSAGTQRGPVVTLAAQITVEDADGGQRAALLSPTRIENLQRNSGMGRDLFDHPSSGRLVQDTVFTLIAANRRHQSRKAALLVAIPPVFQGARGIVVAVFIRPGPERSLAQGVS